MWPAHPWNTTTSDHQSVGNDISLRALRTTRPYKVGNPPPPASTHTHTHTLKHTHNLHITTVKIRYNPANCFNRSFLSLLVKKNKRYQRAKGGRGQLWNIAVHQSSPWPAVQWEAEWQPWPPHLVDLTTLASSWEDDGCPCAKGSETFLPADDRWADKITSDKYYALRCKTNAVARKNDGLWLVQQVLLIMWRNGHHPEAEYQHISSYCSAMLQKMEMRKCKLSCCGQNVHLLCTFLEMSAFDKGKKMQQNGDVFRIGSMLTC